MCQFDSIVRMIDLCFTWLYEQFMGLFNSIVRTIGLSVELDCRNNSCVC